MKRITTWLLSLLTAMLLLAGCAPTYTHEEHWETWDEGITETVTPIKIGENNIEIDPFVDEPWVTVNDNKPFFTEEDVTTEPFELYSELDELGRCGVAFANICTELMPGPTERRGVIGQITPSGWHTIQYDFIDNNYIFNNFTSGDYLYNRCHLIAFQLAGENANEKNLITGTRYMNIDGMLEHENAVADYVKETGNHVLYRVTPVFTGDNLLCDGILIEAQSVEDDGLEFCVFAYNVQPGVIINYATGESIGKYDLMCNDGEAKVYTANPDGIVYVLNTSSMKYHYENCDSVADMSEENRESFNGTTEWLEDNGYEPCGWCNPE